MGMKMTLEIPDGPEGAEILRKISELLNPTKGGNDTHERDSTLEIVKNPQYTPENNPGRRRDDVLIDLENLPIDKLKKASFSEHTIAMIANKVLGVNNFRKNSQETWARSRAWFSEPITESMKALYVGIVNTPPLGKQLSIIGLDEEHRKRFLYLNTDLSIKAAFTSLFKRGMRASAVELAVVGMTPGKMDEVEALLPKANIQLCWEAMMKSAPPPMRPKMKEIMSTNTIKQAMDKYNKVVKSAPDLGKILKPHMQELTAFFHMEPSISYAFKTLGPVYDYEKEARNRLKATSDEQEAKMISTWTALRFQYHWFKIPIDAEQLSNLKYMKHAEKNT